jgi:hypothetical protein
MISFPFRLDGTGRVAKVDPLGDEGRAQRIAEVCRTVKGERPLAVNFGVDDPAWRGLHVADVAMQVATWGPYDVTLSGVEARPDESSQQLVIAFEVHS